MNKELEPVSVHTTFPPSIVIVFTFLYVLATNKKLGVKPKREYILQKWAYFSKKEKYLTVPLDQNNVIALFADKSRIEFLFWDNNGQYIIKEGMHCSHELDKDEIKRDHFYSVSPQYSPSVFMSILDDINFIRESTNEFVSYDVPESHFLLNEQSLEIIIQKFPKCKESFSDMFNYFHDNLFDFLKEKFIF